MSDVIFIVIALLFEFVGPVLLAGLLIWGIWKFIRIRRLRRSLKAAKSDAAALQMEYTRIGAGAVTFLGWASFPVVMAAAMSMGMEMGVSLILASLCCQRNPVWLTASERPLQPGFQGKSCPGGTGKSL